TRFSYVLSLHRFAETADGYDLSAVSDSDPSSALLRDPRFVKEFEELYAYYKEARLVQLRRTDNKLLAVFQTSQRDTDLRVLRWSVDAAGQATYIDNRGERDHVFPPSHSFEWKAITREHQRSGKNPHLSIEDEIFVDTI